MQAHALKDTLVALHTTTALLLPPLTTILGSSPATMLATMPIWAQAAWSARSSTSYPTARVLIHQEVPKSIVRHTIVIGRRPNANAIGHTHRVFQLY